MSKAPPAETPVDEELRVPKTWQPECDLKELKVELPAPQQPSSDVFLKSLLQRKHEKGPETYKMQCELHGVYSIPDQWRAKMVSRYEF